jgi:flagellar export protein FliJ
MQSLLRYRQYLERRMQLEVAKVQSDISECDDCIKKCKSSIDGTFQHLEKETVSGIDGGRYLHYTAYLAGLGSFLESQNLRRKKLFQVLSKKQQKLSQQSVKKKALENLKEHRKEEYYRDLMKCQDKETDDTNILRKARDKDK